MNKNRCNLLHYMLTNRRDHLLLYYSLELSASNLYSPNLWYNCYFDKHKLYILRYCLEK